MHIDHRLAWSTRYVKLRLSEQNLSDRATFFYFLAIITFDWLQFSVTESLPTPTVAPWTLAGVWLTFAATIGGLLYLYRCNGRRGESFLQRYLPLSVTVGWKFFLASFVVVAGSDVVFGPYGRDVSGWFNSAAVTALNVTMFGRIGWHLSGLARVSRSGGNGPSQPAVNR